MGEFVAGDIVVIPFPYTDLSQFKKRPALVIKELESDDLLLVMITSKPYTSAYSLPIDTNDFAFGNLPVNSFARCNRVFEASGSIVLKKAASVTYAFNQKVIDKLIEFLRS